jgi:hypothetical protein
MSNPMSLVELVDQQATLLPARTVLSMLSARLADGPSDTDPAGADGKPGQPGMAGESIPGSGKTIVYGHSDQPVSSSGH